MLITKLGLIENFNTQTDKGVYILYADCGQYRTHVHFNRENLDSKVLANFLRQFAEELEKK